MSTQILLPKLGFSVNEATIGQWLVKDGDTVTKGQPLYTIETDKAVEEIEAPANGTLKIIKAAGDAHEVGTVIGELV
jgi:pyruvate/2-oxoglutarate dehydrogenase complex dihydrolipoamide acyltransferase (E2) component